MRRAHPFLDMSQARWIAKTALSIELRRQGGGKGTRERVTGLLMMALSYLTAGFFMAILFPTGADPFTEGLIACTVLMAFLAVFVGTEFSAMILSPEDQTFYLPLPVSARTYIATKLFVLCSLAGGLALAFAVPFLNIAALRGVPLATIGGLLYSLVASSIVTPPLVAAVLGIAIRFVPSRWIRHAATYAQLSLLFLLYGGFALLQGFLRDVLPSMRIPLTPMLLLAPSAWGPSIFRLAAGQTPAMVGLGFSLLAAPLLFVVCFTIIHAFYGEPLMEVAAATPRSRRRSESRIAGVLWRSPEEKAVALLIRRQFRYSSQFRLSIMMIVPLTAIMLISPLVINKVPILDPFTAEGRAGFPSTILLYLAFAVFPLNVKSSLTYSNEAEASWLLIASPADRALLLRAARRFTELFFLVPYLLAMGAVFFFLTGAIAHTIQHFAMISVLVLIEMDILLFLNPEIPFSRKTTTGMLGAQMLRQLLMAGIVLLLLFLIVLLVYPHPLLYWLVLAGLLACAALVRIRGRRIAATRLADVEGPAA